MKTFLVGGALRDELLNLPIRDRDYAIGQTSEKELLLQGFQKIGTSQPVFLHPKTKDEYILLDCPRNCSEEDLYKALRKDLERRDLSINAIAKEQSSSKLYDPFNGMQDLKNAILRHTSKAFVEDPVRVFRLARFQAQLDFKIAPETLSLCKEICDKPELFQDIPRERYLLELKKALLLELPQDFFLSLKNIGALGLFFPELNQILDSSTEQGPLEALEAACLISKDFELRCASLIAAVVLFHREKQAHEIITKKICNDFKLDTQTQVLTKSLIKNHFNICQALDLDARELRALLLNLNAFRQGDLFEKSLYGSLALALKKNKEEYPPVDFLEKSRDFLRGLNLDEVKRQFSGKQLGVEIEKREIESLKGFISSIKEKGRPGPPSHL